MASWTDEEISVGMQDPAQRDRAFRALHTRYGPRLLGLLVRMCRGDHDRAEDLLCRSLYKAYVHLAGTATPPRSLRAWLYTLTTRTALDELRQATHRDPLHQALPLDEELLRAPADTGSAARSGVLDLAVTEVLSQLEAEDPRYRTLLEMEHIAACDRGEIADATGIERKQLTQYLKRARSRFLILARRHPVLAELERNGKTEARP